MQPLEIALSLVAGVDALAQRLVPAAGDPVDALERALLDCLQRPPCLVAFSGGLDSSVVLAVATDVARRHGLSLPIPATNRFPGVAEVDESRWQEMLVKHLRLDSWIRIDITDELDIIGPFAARHLRAHGVIWPPNAHFLAPLVEAAGSGTLLTGLGGDELFTPSATRVARILAREVPPRRYDVPEFAWRLAPRSLRRRRVVRSLDPPPWLRPAASALWRRVVAQEHIEEPLWWGASAADSWWRSRGRRGVVGSLAAGGAAAAIVHPLMDPTFVACLAKARWRTGFTSREAALTALAGDRVPKEIRARGDKAAFFRPFISDHSRAFIESWTGTGVDHGLVDADILRQVWGESSVDARSYLLLQHAWLARERLAN